MNRRDFARRIFGIGAGGGAFIGVATEATQAIAMVERRVYCPRCLRVFGCVFLDGLDPPTESKGMLIHAPRSAINQPLPVTCDCGWSGTAQFFV